MKEAHKTLMTFIATFAMMFVSFAAWASLPSSTRPVMRGPDSVQAVALTFDDGPHRWHTPELLEILREWNIKASFFVVGQCVAENPGLLQKIHEAGHCIANHSWSHPDLTRLTMNGIVDEVRFCNQVVEALTDERPRFFRPPGGRWDDKVLEVVSNQQLLPVLWTVNGYDVMPKPPEELAHLILRRISPGAIILLHDGGGATARALPTIIETLLSKGYRFVTLEQMFPPKVTPIPLITDSKGQD